MAENFDERKTYNDIIYIKRIFRQTSVKIRQIWLDESMVNAERMGVSVREVEMGFGSQGGAGI